MNGTALEKKCLRSWFMEVLPKLQEISSNQMFKDLFGDVASLGVEGALEACFGLYDDGLIVVLAESTTEYSIFVRDGIEVLKLYDSRKTGGKYA